MNRSITLITTVVAALLILSGCSSTTAPDSTPPSSALIIIESVHANVSAPGIPEALAPTLVKAIEANRPISVIALDGTPAVIYRSGVYSISTANPGAHAADVAREQSAVVAAVGNARADSDGSDLSAGFFLAHDEIASMGATSAHIVVIDSGLPDRGVLTMTPGGMTLADPAAVCRFVVVHDGLPSLAGRHVSVTLASFGYTVSPQQPLTPAQRINVVNIWKTCLTEVGAAVSVLPVPRATPGPKTTHPTGLVVVPPEPDTSSLTAGTIVFSDGSALGFQPASDAYRDDPSAAGAIKRLAGWLTANPRHRVVSIVGTTARVGSRADQLHTSEARAARVGRDLIAAGVNASQVTTSGVGSYWPGYVVDGGPAGPFDEGAAAENRTTVVTLTSR